MEQSSMLFQKDGKNYLQLDCENAKELSMKLGEKTYPFTKDGKKWMLVEGIIPMVEKKYQFGGCKEKRGMAGLSMGSVQTTRTVCDHPDLFSEVGIFSGFLRDFIEGNPDRDVVDRKPYEQTHLKAMDNTAFNSYFHTFLRCIGDKDRSEERR